MNDTARTNQRTDLRTIFPHGSYREVFAVQHCPDPAVIELVDSVSSDPADAALRQFLKTIQRVSS